MIIIVIDNEYNSYVKVDCFKMVHNNIDSMCGHILLQNDCATHRWFLCPTLKNWFLSVATD